MIWCLCYTVCYLFFNIRPRLCGAPTNKVWVTADVIMYKHTDIIQIQYKLPTKFKDNLLPSTIHLTLNWFFFFHLQPDQPASYPSEDLPHGAVYSLDCNHSHFILVEEDPKKPGATSDMRVKLLKHISLQRTGHGGTCIFVSILLRSLFVTW